MFTRIVVPIDLPYDGEHAIPIALALAERTSARVELITVVEPTERGRAETGLRTLADAAGGPSLECRVVETGGPPEAALLTELHRPHNALWCVGSHARGALGELVFGSLSEDLVRDAHLPVMLVGPDVDPARRGSVVGLALDGTPRGEALLPAAMDLAANLGMSLRLLQVIEAQASDVPADTVEAGYLSNVATRYSTDPDYEVLHARDAAKELSSYVERQDEVAVLAISSRGLEGRERLLHGSTAFEVAGHSPVPVLILHTV
jgi:nucleotide-binding universal stress UspA family protein